VVNLSVSEGCVGGLAVFECAIIESINFELMTCNSRETVRRGLIKEMQAITTCNLSLFLDRRRGPVRVRLFACSGVAYGRAV